MSSQRTARRSCNPTITHAIAELTPDACLVMDTDAVILEVNDEAARLYGYRVEELVGMHVSRLSAEAPNRVPSEAVPGARDVGMLLLSTHVHQDGTTFPVEIGWKQGFIGCCRLLVAHVRDISERVRLESDLQLRSDVLDAALDTIIVHDLEGSLLFANSTAAARAGMTHEEFMGLDPWGWLAEDAQGGRAERVAVLVEEGSSVFESQNTAADGSTHPVEVHARIVRFGSEMAVISVVRDISERVKATEAMREMALSDPLTGLANRAHFAQAMERAIADARRHRDALGVLFLDLDDFKPVNDRLGHAAGDEILIDLARNLKSDLRATDTVARMGGDEFAVILTRLTDTESINAAARKIAMCVATPTLISGEYVSVTASIGAALFDPERDDTDALLAKADKAMYQAKRAGVVWCVWGEELQAAAVYPDSSGVTRPHPNPASRAITSARRAAPRREARGARRAGSPR